MSILLHVDSNGCDLCDHVDFSTQGSSYFIIFYVHTVFVSVVILYMEFDLWSDAALLLIPYYVKSIIS